MQKYLIKRFITILVSLLSSLSVSSYAGGSQEEAEVHQTRKRTAESQSVPQDPDDKTEVYGKLWRLTHPQNFGGAEAAAARPLDYYKAGKILLRKAGDIFGKDRAASKLKKTYERLRTQARRAVPTPLTKDKRVRREAAHLINTFEEEREALSQEIRTNAEQDGISEQKLKQVAKRSTSLIGLIAREDSQSTQESTQSVTDVESQGSQDTLIEEPQ